MNKFLFGVCFLAVFLSGCGSAPEVAAAETGVSLARATKTRGSLAVEAETEISPAQTAPTGLSLDAAIQEAARRMDMRLPANTKVALVSVASSSAQLSEYILTRLEAALVDSEKLVVVDRANLDKIRAEQGFQLSGDVSDESAKAIGQLLGAGAIVTGSFSDLGDVYGLTLKAINIETAAVAVSYPVDIAKSTRITTLLAAGGGAAGSGAGYAALAKPVAGGNTGVAPAPEAPLYKIGDKGPAGGIIFYDKFSRAGGWRYLEAAPQETKQALAWGRFANFDGTTTAVGGGKNNTELVVQAAKNLLTAARFCGDLEYGGYDDWFLPSKDELDLMYKNLKANGLGVFSGDIYWSSSYSGGWDSGPWRQGFRDGVQRFDSIWTGSGGSNVYTVRAIRQF
jgi:hypothetical protein